MLSDALAPPRLLNAATRSSIAFFACGCERLDCRVTGPLPDWVLLPDGLEVTQPLISAAAPTAPAPARNPRRLGGVVFMERLPRRPGTGPGPLTAGLSFGGYRLTGAGGTVKINY